MTTTKGKPAGIDPRVQALAAQLETACAGLSQTVQNVLQGTPPAATRKKPCGKDAYVGAKPQSPLGDEGSASSTTPRARGQAGVPLHELMISQGHLGTSAVQADGRLFAWDPKADTSLDEISTRKLLQYYESSMGSLHDSLGRMDFDRKEGLWYERYREDLWTDIDRDESFYRNESRYADDLHYADAEADRMAYDYQFSTSSYYDYDDQYR